MEIPSIETGYCKQNPGKHGVLNCSERGDAIKINKNQLVHDVLHIFIISILFLQF